MSTVKDELTQLIQQQPEDSTSEEIIRELAFHVMVQRGLSDSDAKRVISNEEMERRIRSWASQGGQPRPLVGSRTSTNT